MHLLAAQAGLVSDGSEPVDPGQDPAEVLFLSAADTEICCLSAANTRLDSSHDFLRLTQLSWLSHPFSVDRYIDRTALGSRLVIVRALGGMSYWQYCLEQMSSRLPGAGIRFAALPGDNRYDPELREISTLDDRDWNAIFDYCRHGGLVNSQNLLRYCRYLVHGETRPCVSEPTPHADTYRVRTKTEAPDSPLCGIVFYRALVHGGNLEPVDALCKALEARNIRPEAVYVTSLKDPHSADAVRRVFNDRHPDVIVNMTCFSVSKPCSSNADWQPTVLSSFGCPVLQVALAANDLESWQNSQLGLVARDLAMNVALTEHDGNVFTRAIGFKSQPETDPLTQMPISIHRPVPDRVEYVAELVARWIRLQRSQVHDRRVALLLANYPNRDGRIANGVGLDTPASVAEVIGQLGSWGYDIGKAPVSADRLMRDILSGPTNTLSGREQLHDGAWLPMSEYMRAYDQLPACLRQSIEGRWGQPGDDPFCLEDRFQLAMTVHGNLAIGVQPARGYNIDPVDTYHSPDLVPPHNYLAFYFWLTGSFKTHAVIHMGKHGNLEWLPGKAHGLSAGCCPEAALGPLPNIYPFIVNDPGEGSQAKRRLHSVIIDHLTPPMARAESHGNYRELEILLDELYEAAGLDSRRVELLQDRILKTMSSSSLDEDIGIVSEDDDPTRLKKLDAYLCEIKESQIRDGLHIFGQSPVEGLETSLIVSMLRVPRGDGQAEKASILRAIASDLHMGTTFDPLDCDMSREWQHDRPEELQHLTRDRWRTSGDTVERLELLAEKLVAGLALPPGPASKAVLEYANSVLRPALSSCGPEEMNNLRIALEGRFVPPGSSGAPTRGRLDVLPTGRNFHSLDSRSLPRRTAWELGFKSASMLVDRYLQDHGEWPTVMAVTAWGTANMRTGGDDIAQALALIGVMPQWDDTSGRVVGYEIMPAEVLGRPRVDVTLRVSGLFRDAFPAQMDLFASASRSVMELDEPPDQNPARAAWLKDSPSMGAEAAAFRVFGSMPGAYGAGLQALIDEGIWDERSDFARSYIEWGHYAYGSGADGQAERKAFSTRLARVEAVVQNQDNREHDILDSDDYYQFEGGMAAAVEFLRGERPSMYHNDHSRPERPVIRTLQSEIGRVVRARATNPKWICGVRRHGYKGAFEMAATVDYLFAFAATTGLARSHHFDLVYDAYIADDENRDFMDRNNPDALNEMALRFLEAINRGLWHPRSNSCRDQLNEITGAGGKSTG